MWTVQAFVDLDESQISPRQPSRVVLCSVSKMGGERSRWRRAATISTAAHAIVGVLAWLSFYGPGSAKIALRYDELRARVELAGRFEPGAVIPFEISRSVTQGSTAAAVEPGQRALEPASTPIPGSSRPASSASKSAPLSSKSAPLSSKAGAEAEAALDAKAEGMLGGRGLAGAGETKRALDPGLLAGGRSIYDEAPPAAVREGPAPSSASAPLPKDFSFEREGGKWIYRDPGGSFVATLQPDGGVEFRNKLVRVSVGSTSGVNSIPGQTGNGEEFITLKVEYDPVGIARLARGRDPSPRVKAALLAATFEMRLEHAIAYHERQMIEELGALEDQLERIWRRSGHSPKIRRELLFEVWDGCQESGSGLVGFRVPASADAAATLDETRRKLATAARRKVLRFIRAELPVGSTAAYTPGELASLNARRVSAQAFAPYG